MKRTILSLAALILLALILISQKDSEIELKGTYNILGVSRTDNVTWKEFDSLGYWDHGENHFDFRDNDIVRVNKKLCDIYFKDTLFTYSARNGKFILTNLDSTISHDLNYDLEGNVFNVNLKNEAWARMQLGRAITECD